MRPDSKPYKNVAFAAGTVIDGRENVTSNDPTSEPVRGVELDPDVEGGLAGMLRAARAHLGVGLVIVDGPCEGRQVSAARAPLRHEGRDDAIALPLLASGGRALGSLVCTSPAGVSEVADKVAALELLARLIADRIERRDAELESWRARIAATSVQALLAALGARDGYTKDHSEAVVELSEIAGEELGLSSGQIDEVKQVALLHDLGKIAIPEPILAKPHALAEDEWHKVRQHSAIGARIVASVDSLSHLAPAIRAGHERWDGRGYPDGLAGEEIPLTSRIVSLCDAYDAMVSDRPYRKALPRGEAMDELARAAGTQFCPTCVEALTRVA